MVEPYPLKKFRNSELKVLITIAVLQTGLLLYLFLKVTAVANNVDALASAPHDVPAPETTRILTPQGNQASVFHEVNGQLLRQIIREELRASRYTGNSQAEPINPPEDKEVVDEAEMQFRRDRVVEEFEYLLQQEEITGVEMEKLLGDIAQLDPEGRTEMLGMLNRAMNRGEIKGNL